MTGKEKKSSAEVKYCRICNVSMDIVPRVEGRATCATRIRKRLTVLCCCTAVIFRGNFVPRWARRRDKGTTVKNILWAWTLGPGYPFKMPNCNMNRVCVLFLIAELPIVRVLPRYFVLHPPFRDVLRHACGVYIHSHGQEVEVSTE